ncbi:hypothetical protein OEA41_005281 [Lepraria neglecta]|uniref:Phosphoribosylglycinamide synthetase ATP-grasp (A) domain-containing protein n=1 Tax=Lepraria neglecta TaxID=209136 RepID=A0AAD9Z3I2_9LECA|nr:hypothetical protein OEA41_005281 [Lepraria neglecta]
MEEQTARGPDKASNVDSTKADDYPALVELPKSLKISLFVAGTDQAVVDGIEGFCNEAEYGNFSSYDQAKSYLVSATLPVVIKASGLAAGKVVVIAEEFSNADEILKEFMLEGKFGSAGSFVVIEEFLTGDETSILTFSDGNTTRTLPPSQDHKRIFDGSLLRFPQLLRRF